MYVYQLEALHTLAVVGNRQVFLDGETAMFNGRSPSGRLLPAGVSAQPLGRCTLRDSSWAALWALIPVTRKAARATSNILCINSVESKLITHEAEILFFINIFQY